MASRMKYTRNESKLPESTIPKSGNQANMGDASVLERYTLALQDARMGTGWAHLAMNEFC